MNNMMYNIDYSVGDQSILDTGIVKGFAWLILFIQGR